MRKGFMALSAAALLALPAVPAAAATAETCHPPYYDTVGCVCRAVVTILTKVTGDPWTCAS